MQHRPWDPRDDDATIYDCQRGAFADPSQVREIDFQGEFFRSRAPLRRAVAAAAAGALAGRFFGAGLVLETVGLGQCSADSRLLRRRQADAARVPARVTWGRFGR
jgi:long-chain alkane monooxygenase